MDYIERKIREEIGSGDFKILGTYEFRNFENVRHTHVNITREDFEIESYSINLMTGEVEREI